MSRHKVARKNAQLNLTPMLDLVFQLIVFFLLVTNFSAAQLPDLDPPEPEDSQAQAARDRDRVIVNVLPDGETGEARSIHVGLRRLDPQQMGELRRLLEEARDRRSDDGGEDMVEVDLRADGRIEYGNIRPIMNAITEAGISRINLVARDPPNRRPAQ